jgi:hypothetical protein
VHRRPVDLMQRSGSERAAPYLLCYVYAYKYGMAKERCCKRTTTLRLSPIYFLDTQPDSSEESRWNLCQLANSLANLTKGVLPPKLREWMIESLNLTLENAGLIY